VHACSGGAEPKRGKAEGSNAFLSVKVNAMELPRLKTLNAENFSALRLDDSDSGY
jgi:hypothetical protein